MVKRANDPTRSLLWQVFCILFPSCINKPSWCFWMAWVSSITIITTMKARDTNMEKHIKQTCWRKFPQWLKCLSRFIISLLRRFFKIEKGIFEGDLWDDYFWIHLNERVIYINGGIDFRRQPFIYCSCLISVSACVPFISDFRRK